MGGRGGTLVTRSIGSGGRRVYDFRELRRTFAASSARFGSGRAQYRGVVSAYALPAEKARVAGFDRTGKDPHDARS
jgi:hypothetical protein